MIFYNYGRMLGLSLILFSFVAWIPASSLAQSAEPAEQLASPGVTPTVDDNPELVERFQKTITASDLAAHLYLFASDYFEGRETSTRGQKLAANYLAAQYRKMGLLPKGTGAPSTSMEPAAYLQPFPLYGLKISSATLTVASNGKTIATTTFSPDNPAGQSFLSFGQTPEVTGSVVFGGYGIADEKLGYDDYAAMKDASIDPTGGWLIILGDEPLASAEKSLLPTDGGGPSGWTTNRFDKIRTMMSSLPKGVLIVGDSSPRNSVPFAERAKRAAEALNGVGSLSLTPPTGESGQRRQLPPMYTVSSEFVDALLASTGKTVAALQKEIDSSLKPVVFEVKDVTVSSSIKKKTYETSSENVAAYIEGSDPLLRDEFVVISAHYDHLGMTDRGDEDGIFNGADDDGSGTVSVLEIAEGFQKAKDAGFGPRRSMLFLNVTGEEKGLLGSAHFTDSEPLVPLDHIVTDLNIDMIGRVDPTHPGKDDYYVYIIGSNLISQELHNINARVNEITGINLDLNQRFNSKDDPNQFYRRSDHWNFGKHNIPFIFFFTGTHPDYHGVDDEPQKIKYERMASIDRMIFATAWQVANQDNRPTVSGKGFN